VFCFAKYRTTMKAQKTINTYWMGAFKNISLKYWLHDMSPCGLQFLKVMSYKEYNVIHMVQTIGFYVEGESYFLKANTNPDNKVKLSPILIKHHTIKGSGGIAPLFLGGKRSASCPGCFTPGKRAPGTHWIEEWVGPRASLETEAKRKIFLPLLGNEPQSSSPQSVTVLTELPWLLH
jgi:hypothetical protein